MERILRHPLLSPTRVPGRAFLLETPIDAPGDDRRNVAAVWKCVGVAAEQMPDAEDGFSMVRGKRKAKTRTFRTEKRRKQRSRGEGRRAVAKKKLTWRKAKTKSKKGKRN
jgi:hypothetical protein